jgi:protein ImuB
VDSARPHRAQHGLFLPQAPEPGRLEVLLARLRKLLGENRVGAPRLVDSHRPESFHMADFSPPAPRQQTPQFSAKTVLRVCRPLLAIHVTIRAQKPLIVAANGTSYTVLSHAGPWRSSGEWWSETCWCREEWDVELSDDKTRMISRIAYDPASNCWYMQGIYD